MRARARGAPSVASSRQSRKRSGSATRHGAGGPRRPRHVQRPRHRWFNLRDSQTGHPGVFQNSGLPEDDYDEKPAFAAYRELVGRFAAAEQRPSPGLGALSLRLGYRAGRTAGGRRCTRSRVRASVAGKRFARASTRRPAGRTGQPSPAEPCHRSGPAARARDRAPRVGARPLGGRAAHTPRAPLPTMRSRGSGAADGVARVLRPALAQVRAQ